MITPSFNLTATERVLPKLALDFTTANLDSRITFTRTTNATNPATYTNSSGYIVAATDNQPRFDYNPITLACKGLLIEESRSNLLTYSEQFENAAWQKVRSSISEDAIVSPSGLTDADKLVEDTSTNSHYILKDFTNTSNTTYTVTVYAKAAGRRYLRVVGSTTGNASSQYANFDLTNGSVGAPVGGAVVSISAAGNDWYRCSVTFTSNTDATYRVSMWLLSDSQSASYTGNGTSGAYLWGAQLEAGAFATSYIPTTSAALTRNADVATMTGTNFSDWWTATNGASDIWLTPKSTSTLAYMSFDDNTANNKIVIANSTTSGQSTITSGGVLQSTLTAGTITANATNKVGCSWNTNNCAATANATTPATTASATIPTVTQLRIGSNGSAYANAWVQKLFYWPQRITNNEIQAFTK